MNDPLREALTMLLGDLREADGAGWDAVLPQIYDQLHGLAGKIAGPHSASATLTPTVLVHEAWAKLARTEHPQFRNREHFLAVAAVTMRQVLIDGARRRVAAKRGGGNHRVTLADFADEPVGIDLLELDDALRRLAERSSRQSRIVELRFFSGLTILEVARCLGISEATVEADWRLARAWLTRELSPPT